MTVNEEESHEERRQLREQATAQSSASAILGDWASETWGWLITLMNLNPDLLNLTALTPIRPGLFPRFQTARAGTWNHV